MPFTSSSLLEHDRRISELLGRFKDLAGQYVATLKLAAQDLARLGGNQKLIAAYARTRAALAATCQALGREYAWLAALAAYLNDRQAQEAFAGAAQMMGQLAQFVHDGHPPQLPQSIRGTDFSIALSAARQRMLARMMRRLDIRLRRMRRKPDHGRQGRTAPASTPRLYRAAQVAGQQYEQALQKTGRPLTDDQAYSYVCAHCESPDELPQRETWKRQLRAYRKAAGQRKNSPRAGRAKNARSIIPPDATR
ncbi:hypothetical protein [Fontivita pretiosa]|uniref:hypothetical protein n=1 Tax=Fontivita pretiosa TaxID=2989684 RepID=UPI003D16CF6D